MATPTWVLTYHVAYRKESMQASDPTVQRPNQMSTLLRSGSWLSLALRAWRLGGVEGLLHGLGTDRLRGLSTKFTGPIHRGPPDPAIIDALAPCGVEKTPNTSPTGGSASEGLQSAASLGGSAVQRSASLKCSGTYKASIEDRQRIYGHNILPQRPKKCLLLSMWLAFHDKVIVSAKISHSFP